MAEGQRRRVLDTGVGINALSTLTGGVAEQFQRRQAQEQELKLAITKLLAEKRLGEMFPSAEEQTKRQALSVAQSAGRVPQPMGGYNRVEQSAGIPEQVEQAANTRFLDTAQKYGILPKPPLTAEDILARSEASAQGRQNVLAPRQDFLDSTKIREEFINRPEVKEYVSVGGKVRQMDSLLQAAKTGDVQNKVALDQGLITLFNKITDPNSVVRESEYARTPQNLPLANRFSGALQKLQRGGAGLTDSDRAALVWGAKVIANEEGGTFNTVLQEYTNLGSKYGLDTSVVTRGLSPHIPYDLEGSTQSSSQQSPASIGFRIIKRESLP